MARDISAYLQDILDACNSIQDVMNGISLDDYRSKRAVRSAVEREFIIIGEASLSDPAMEDVLIEVPVMRRFAGIDMMSDRIPDETTILAFRYLLEKHDLGQRIFDTVKAHLKAKGAGHEAGHDH